MERFPERHCAACGAQNLVSARFCTRCGTPVSGSCRACGAALPLDARFCPECGDAVGRTPPIEGEERKLVTILFSDVEGSTALGERLDPERLKEVMGAYFDAMQAEIEAEGGTVEKFIGDAVMAVFGVPTAHEDDPVRALRAADRMLSRLDALNRELDRTYGVTLAMRIGVNTGEVVATALPAPGRGMVAGDAVNVAARLEQMASPGHVLVGPRTARAASRRVTLRDVGSQEVRGKVEPVRVFELVDVGRAEAAGTTTTELAPGAAAPLVGRARELRLLQALLERATAERHAHLVTIYGEAGVGKSRLVQEFEAWTTTRPAAARSVRGRCLPYGEGITYWPLAEILKSHAGVLDDDAPALAMTRVAGAVEELLAAGGADRSGLVTVVRALAFTAGIEEAEGRPDPDPRQVLAETRDAWQTFFSALANSGPVVAVIEDIHWADAALLDLLEELVDRTRAPVLFLCPSRQELREHRPSWGGGKLNGSSLLLEPLSGSESETLLDHLLGHAVVSPGLRARILQRAGGNPFFLEEIVRRLVDEGRLSDAGTPGSAVPELDDLEIPETVQGVLAARMDLLDPGDKRVLQRSAVVGRTFWPGAVERLLDGDDRPAPAVVEVLARLEERGLVRSRMGSTMGGEREFAFHHVLTRDVAYQSLPRRERAGAHAAVGTWIEERAGERLRGFAELLSYHYVEAHAGFADDPRRGAEEIEALRHKAFGFTLMASEVARTKAVLGKAQRYAEVAVTLAADDVQRSTAYEAAGLAYFHDSQGDLAWKALQQAIDLRVEGAGARAEAIDGGRDRDVARLCAAALEIATRSRGAMRQRIPPERLEPYLRIGLEHAGEGDSEERTRLLIARSFWPRAESSVARVDERTLAEARRVGEEGFAMAQRLRRPLLASAALDAVCATHLLVGRYGRMEEPLRRRLGLVDSIQDPFELGDIYGTAAWWAVNSGRYREALGFADLGLARTESRSSMYALYCLDFRAVAAFRLGDWERFLADVERAGELLGDRRDQPPGYAAVHVALAAFVHDVRGDRERADRNLRIVEWLEGVEERPDTAWTLWRSRLLARRARFAEARELLSRPEIAEHGEGREEALESWCELLAEEGRWDEAPAVADDARRYAEWAGVPSLRPYADRLEGRAALAAGDDARAVELLAAAVEGFERLEAAWEVAVTKLHAARALRSSGREGEARRHLLAAVPTLERLASRRELAEASALLDVLG